MGYKKLGGKIGGVSHLTQKMSFILNALQQVFESPKRTIPLSQNVLKA
jgi:hypothetical protein